MDENLNLQKLREQPAHGKTIATDRPVFRPNHARYRETVRLPESAIQQILGHAKADSPAIAARREPVQSSLGHVKAHLHAAMGDRSLFVGDDFAEPPGVSRERLAYGKVH